MKQELDYYITYVGKRTGGGSRYGDYSFHGVITCIEDIHIIEEIISLQQNLDECLLLGIFNFKNNEAVE